MTPASAADGRAVCAVRVHLAAGDGDIARRDELTAADACAVVAAAGVDLAAVNVDIIGCGVAIHVLLRSPAASADTGSCRAAGGGNIAAVDVDIAAAAFVAAADAGTHFAARRLDFTGVEIQLLAAAVSAAADARAVFAALGDDGAAPERGVRLRAEVHIHAVAVHVDVENLVGDIPDGEASADARAGKAALTRHRGALHHLHAQLSLAAVLLNGRPSGGPRQLTVPVYKIQIRRRLSMQLDGRRLGVLLHLNIHVIQEDVRRRLLSVDLDLLGPDPLRIVRRGINVVGPAVPDVDVARPSDQVDFLVEPAGDVIHRPRRRRRHRRRQQRQHHAAQQQDAKHSFLHWLFSSCSCGSGLSAPAFFLVFSASEPDAQRGDRRCRGEGEHGHQHIAARVLPQQHRAEDAPCGGLSPHDKCVRRPGKCRE